MVGVMDVHPSGFKIDFVIVVSVSVSLSVNGCIICSERMIFFFIITPHQALMHGCTIFKTKILVADILDPYIY